MIYFLMDGAIWRLTEANYRKMVREMKTTGGIANVDAYGKVISQYLDINDVRNDAAMMAEEQNK